MSSSAAHSNIAIGASSGDYSLTSGQCNIFLGHNAGKNLTSASRVVFIGRSAGFSFATRGDNICIGDESGKYAVHTDSSSATIQGIRNIFFGVRAGYHHVGYDNIAIGYHAGSGEASDWGTETYNNYNISIGSYALSNYTGKSSAGWGWNHAFGGSSMRYIKDGIANVALGYYALRGDSTAAVSDGSYNTSIGHNTMTTITTGDNNVALGSYAGYVITASGYNTLLGSFAGRYITSDSQGDGGSYNICIGYATGPDTVTGDRINDSNRLYIDLTGGYKEHNSLIYGDQSGTNQDLTLNADVVISDSGHSNGNLTVVGDITLHDGGSLKEAGGLEALTFDASGNITRIGRSSQTSSDSGKYLKWDGSNAVWDTVSSGSDLTGLTASVPELNKLDGVTATTTELNSLDITTVGRTENSKVVTTDSSGDIYFTGNTAYSDMIWVKSSSRLEFRNPNSAGDGYDVYTSGTPPNETSVPDTLKIYQNGSYGMIQTNNRDLKIDASGGSMYFTTNNNVYFNASNGRYSFNRGSVEMIKINVNDADGHAKIENQKNGGSIDFETRDSGGTATSMLKINDTSSIDFLGGSSSSGVTINSSGDITASRHLVVEGEATTGAHRNGLNYDGSAFNNATLALITAGSGSTTAGTIKSWGWSTSNLGSKVVTFNSGGTGMQALSLSQVCFLPGTKITLSDKIKINIENLKKGDTLLSYKLDDMPPYNKSVDVLSWFSEEDTGEFTESEVTNIWSDISPGYIILNDNLHVTHEHLIFTKMDDEFTWLSAKEIRVGDIVFTDKGEYEEITKVERIKREVTVYNLRVTSSAMNYFADSYLVHNASLCDECAAKNNKL